MPDRDEAVGSEPKRAAPHQRVQCSNCCQLAPVTGTEMGLLLYVCELCGTSGATTPDAVIVLPELP